MRGQPEWSSVEGRGMFRARGHLGVVGETDGLGLRPVSGPTGISKMSQKERDMIRPCVALRAKYIAALNPCKIVPVVLLGLSNQQPHACSPRGSTEHSGTLGRAQAWTLGPWVSA